MLYSVLGSMWRCRNEGLGEASNRILRHSHGIQTDSEFL